MQIRRPGRGLDHAQRLTKKKPRRVFPGTTLYSAARHRACATLVSSLSGNDRSHVPVPDRPGAIARGAMKMLRLQTSEGSRPLLQSRRGVPQAVLRGALAFRPSGAARLVRLDCRIAFATHSAVRAGAMLKKKRKYMKLKHVDIACSSVLPADMSGKKTARTCQHPALRADAGHVRTVSGSILFHAL